MTTQPQNSAEALAVIRKLPERQQDVLSACAIGQDAGQPKNALRQLIAKGLLTSWEERWGDRFGALTVQRYEVPIFVHIAWCEWCSEQPDEEAAATQ